MHAMMTSADVLKLAQDVPLKEPQLSPDRSHVLWNYRTHKDIDLVDILHGNLYNIGLRNCHGERCLLYKSNLDTIAPLVSSQWKNMRRWALVAKSCRESHLDDPKGSCCNNPSSISDALRFCKDILLDLGRFAKWAEHDGVDKYGLCELLFWIIPNSNRSTHSRMLRQLFNDDLLSIPQVRQGIQCLGDHDICQNRLWKLANATEKGLFTLPALLRGLKGFELAPGHREAHRGCNAQFCLLSSVNTTRVEQCHVCAAASCGQVSCPPEKLNSLQDGTTGVWSVLPRKVQGSIWKSRLKRTVANMPTLEIATEYTSYMAISHVWSDGTGVGLKAPGQVNYCLFQYFGEFAALLGCTSIWWDTICIPLDKEKRQKTLATMHQNYRRARYTLVHDREVASFKWRDDGSPCLALVLSTWFTRGWTALELYASKSVKVLFSDENGRPVIKDLEKDILTDDDNVFAHPEWVEASKVIRRVQRKQMQGDLEHPVSHILAILKHRNTCWDQDRMLIASLMTELGTARDDYLDFVDEGDSERDRNLVRTILAEGAAEREREQLQRGNSNDSDVTLDVESKKALDAAARSGSDPVRVTQAILKRCRHVPRSALFHGMLTMSPRGPWSWCPVSFFDLADHYTNSNPELSVGQGGELEGTLSGSWLSAELKVDIAPRLRPISSHPAVWVRVSEALRGCEDKSYLLLSHGDRLANANNFLLAENFQTVESPRTQKKGMKHRIRSCGYVGAVSSDISKYEWEFWGRMSFSHVVFV